MRIFFYLLTFIAVLLSIFILALIFLSISVGGGNVLFPGLGLVVSLPFLIAVVLVIDATIMALAFLLKRSGLK